MDAAKLGIPGAIVNQGPTRGDSHATLIIDAPLGTLLPELVRRVNDSASSRPHPDPTRRSAERVP